jgi:hypothetical protein
VQDFTRPSGRLRRLPFAARLVYSVFLLFTLAGLGITAWLTQDMLDADLSELQPYYAGDALESGLRAPPQVADGPALELPEEAETIRNAEPMPLRKLLEVTHFHLFSMPVYLMILSHLFMLARWGERAKVFWIGAATLAVIAHLIAPWWVRARAPLGNAVYGGSGLLLAISFLVMACVPLLEMWRRPSSDAAP